MKHLLLQLTQGRPAWLRRLQSGLGLATLLGALTAAPSQAQTPTPGLIFQPATAGVPGAGVLDPNNDGYVSASSQGFSAGDVGSQSEIPYRYISQLLPLEPNADLRVGPSHKFTDFADVSSGQRAVGFYKDASDNYMFRFRLGGSAPNSKGYSVAIDTDGKFGFTGPNADPNAVLGNPGFEIEIMLATNFGVRLFDLDGKSTPTGSGPDGSLIQLPYISYAQKAVATTTNNTDLDVFYDFYIPLSVLQAQLGSRTIFDPNGTQAVPFSNSTPLRMVANTIISPHTVTQYQNISDIGGLNDTQNPVSDLAYIKIITTSTPTTGSGVQQLPSEAIPLRTTPPVVNAPLQSGGTLVRGTSTEAVGTVITVYVNGNAVPTTTTVQAGGTWQLTVPALATNDLVKATATAVDKSASEFSNVVPVVATPACNTPAPTISCSSDRSIAGSATPGAQIYLRYPDGTLVGLADRTRNLLANPVTADASGFFLFTSQGGNSTCGNGQTNALQGTYLVSYAPSGGCEGASSTVCINAPATAAPVLTTPLPITPNTAQLNGTAPAGSSIAVLIDGLIVTRVTTAANGTFTIFGGGLTEGRVITLNATLNANACVSPNVNLRVVAERTVIPPVVTSPLVTGVSTITGTSVEPAGSTITLTTYAGTAGAGTATGTYTTTVQADGTWSVAVPARPAGTSVKATVRPADYNTSDFSNVVPVLDRTATRPVITGTYLEKNTSVSGTSASPVGSIITVYIDGGDPIGTTTVQPGGTWTLTGLSDGSGVNGNTPYPTLYAGGILTATSTETGKLPSLLSDPVTVLCPNIANKAYTPSATSVCAGNTVTFTVQNVEPGIIYTLQDAANANTGISRLATTESNTLTLTTSTLNTAGTYQVKLNAFSIGATNCSNTSATSVPITVNALPLDRSTAAGSNPLPAGVNYTDITVASSEVGVTYQLVNLSTSPSTNVGAPQNGNGSTLTFRTNTVTGPTTYAIQANNVPGCSRQLSNPITLTRSGPLPVELVSFTAQARGNSAELSWRTAQEKDNDHFEVERSIDGREFRPVATLRGQGTTTSATDYRWVDAQAGSQGRLVYYRLKQVDTDGSNSNSDVRTVSFGAAQEVLLQVYPNPVSQDGTLDMVKLPKGSYRVQVLDLTGRIMGTYRLNGGQENPLPLHQLPAGVYQVRVVGDAATHTVRLVKE